MLSLFQDPAAVNWATWSGLVLTVIGFGVSIQQIMKVKSAARAAERATRAAFAVMKERIGLTDVMLAISHMEVIVLAIESKDYLRAIGTIRLLRPKLIELRQLPFDQQYHQSLSEHLSALSVLSEELEGAVRGAPRIRVPYPRELERISDTLHHYASKLRYGAMRDFSEAV